MPFVSEEAKASSAPPIRLVTIGDGPKKVELGVRPNCTGMRKFFHPTIMPSSSRTQRRTRRWKEASAAQDLVFDRVSQTLALDMLAVRNDSGDASTFAAMASRVANEGLPMVLMSDRPEALRQAAAGLTRPLLYAATAENVEEMAAVAKELKCPLALRSEDLNTLADMAERARKAGVEDLMLDLAPQRAKDLVEKNTIVRKNAVKKTFRGLGYPIVLNACGDERAVLKAMLSTMKYGGIVLLDDLDPAHALPLFVLRQNIYTDPQVPIQVKAGLYPVNDPREDSPILFTTNFSLTYYTVLADIEKSKVPAWLLVVDTEGLSVLTAFSAGKLSAESVVTALEETSAKERSKKGTLIIPGMLSRMSGKLQELSGLKVVVGPRESSGIPKR